ncbi:MAG: hypothetical protein IJZ73_03230 [Clostridia bacterium]|nr:hypothetical protein [Clostridia bacterium]
MQEEQKTLKQYCREAKKRLKQGFWQSYRSQLDQELIKAEKAGISTSKVKEYYNQRVAGNIRRVDEESEAFYLKVKKILDEEGEISGVLGRLTDKEYYQTLSYEEQQRYNLTLSERYLKAVERYNKEKSLGV